MSDTSQSLIHLSDYSYTKIISIIQQALALKEQVIQPKTLSIPKSISAIFFNPSLRTQTSLQVAAWELGAQVSTLNPGANTWNFETETGIPMDGDKQEHAKEVAQVLSGYVDLIAVRKFSFQPEHPSIFYKDPFIETLKEYSKVPILNLEHATAHPMQALADLMTMEEVFPKKKKKVIIRWAPHPKPLPRAVPYSFAHSACMTGNDVIIQAPKAYLFPDEVLDELTSSPHAGTVSQTTERTSERDAHIIYAKSWHPIPLEVHEYATAQAWRITEDIFNLHPEARFMHCLPIRRNVVADDAVIDHPQSVLISQAHNRKFVQKSLLMHLWNLQ